MTDMKNDGRTLFSENQNFEVWEVTPLKKGTRIFFESC